MSGDETGVPGMSTNTQDPDVILHSLDSPQTPLVTEQTTELPSLPSALHDSPTHILPDPVAHSTDAPQSNSSGISVRPHSTFSLPSCANESNFCRNAQWCADGTSVLVVLEDASIEVLNV
jgi:hypothetical protein